MTLTVESSTFATFDFVLSPISLAYSDLRQTTTYGLSYSAAPMVYIDRMTEALRQRREKGTIRHLLHSESQASAEQSLIDFSSNCYLSLSKSSSLRSDLLACLAEGALYGPSSSRLLDGNTEAHLALENRMAAFFCSDTALLFNSGYDANMALYSTIASPQDVILYDELIHASAYDGMRASRAKQCLPFAHSNLKAFSTVLQTALATHEALREGNADVWIGVEALYSMDGDEAPLLDLLAIAKEIMPHGNAHFIVDEAHATGIIGPRGRGLTCELGLAHRVVLRVHTFGKSLSCNGAVVLCDQILRDFLINYARPLIYSTTLSYLNVSAIACSFKYLENGHLEQAASAVRKLAAHLLAEVLKIPTTRYARLPSPLPSSSSPILPILSCDSLALERHLRGSGFNVRALRFPTVPRGTERIRITLHATNTIAQIDGLVAALRHWLSTNGVISHSDHVSDSAKL